MACTPLISRQAIPAIFCTTLCATLILPSSVDRRSAVPGLSSLVLAAGLADGAELLVCVITVHSFCRSVEGRSVEAAACRPRRVGTGFFGPLCTVRHRPAANVAHFLPRPGQRGPAGLGSGTGG